MQEKKATNKKARSNTADRTNDNKPETNVPIVRRESKPIIEAGESLMTSYDPHKNPKAISIIQQEDGNYIGEMQINGKLKTTRQISPESVLQYLLYHDYGENSNS